MEEVVGSIPTRSTKFPSCLSLLYRLDLRVLCCAQDFACGLGRPQNGSSSIPTRSTKSIAFVEDPPVSNLQNVPCLRFRVPIPYCSLANSLLAVCKRG